MIKLDNIITVLFSLKARDSVLCAIFHSASILQNDFVVPIIFYTIRSTPIRIDSVVVVDITRRVHIPCIVSITTITATQTNILCP